MMLIKKCTKKYSTLILLRNFYVGISSWYRYVLDTLTGGNFLGTPAFEACNLIESLVGAPPLTKEVKTEITLEDIINKLDSMENFFPTLLESVVSTNERITALETSNTLDTKNHRIDGLEEAMETLSSIFSSIKTKKEKAFVGSEQKFIYIPKPKPIICLKMMVMIYVIGHLHGYLKHLLQQTMSWMKLLMLMLRLLIILEFCFLCLAERR